MSPEKLTAELVSMALSEDYDALLDMLMSMTDEDLEVVSCVAEDIQTITPAPGCKSLGPNQSTG